MSFGWQSYCESGAWGPLFVIFTLCAHLEALFMVDCGYHIYFNYTNSAKCDQTV